MKKNSLTILKLILTGIIIYFLSEYFSFKESFYKLAHLDSWYLFLTFILSFCIMIIQAYRWKILTLIPENSKPSTWEFFKYISIGYFANIFMPSSIGGDVIKSVFMGRKIQNVTRTVSSIFVARICGIFAFVIIFWISYLLFNIPIPQLETVIAILLGLSLTIISFIVFVLILAPKNVRIPGKNIISTKIQGIISNLIEYKSEKKILTKSLLISLIMQFTAIVTFYVAMRSTGGNIKLSECLLFVPLTTLISFLPLTINSIGIRETASIFFFASLPQITAEQCITTAMIGYILSITQALFGSIFVIWHKREQKNIID